LAFLAFVATILALTATAWMMVSAFVHSLVPGGWLTFVAAWGVSVAPIFVLLVNLTAGGYPSAFVRIWVFRFFWYAQLLMLALAFTAVVGFVVGLPFGASDRAGRWMILTMAPILVLVAIWGYVGARRLVTRRFDVFFSGLPAGLEGLCIVQLSDLHVGPHTPRRHLRKIAEETLKAAPHIIAYTGDQVDDYPRDTEVFAKAFGHLGAQLGSFAIPGNHDIYAGWNAVRRGLEQAGVTVLVNSAVRLTHNGSELWLAGTGDPAGSQFRRGGSETAAPNIERTLTEVPRGAFCVVLAHNPALWPALAARGVPLTLSGHTHYGQLSTKNWSLASAFLELAMGSHERGGSLLYISPGTNYWGIPFRIGALPEVTVLTLRAGAPARVALSEPPSEPT
jgi:predicted MPP superfamily phosphohydrolase